MKTVYLAGAIAGLSETDAVGWRVTATIALAAHNLKGVTPLRNEPSQGGKYWTAVEWKGQSAILAKGVASKNLHDVRNCDMILVYLPKEAIAAGPRYGTVLEIGWGYILGKPIVLVSDDVGIMTHPCVDLCVGWKAESLDEGVRIVTEILGPYA